MIFSKKKTKININKMKQLWYLPLNVKLIEEHNLQSHHVC